MTETKTEIKIAYQINNLPNDEYCIKATLMDSIDKIFEEVSNNISIKDFNSTMEYSQEEKELLIKANDLVKTKTAQNIANILEKDITRVVEKIKSTSS